MDTTPITKADLDAAIAPLATKAQLEELEERLDKRITERITEVRDFLVEAIHDSQTELLRGIEVLVRGNEGRLHRLEIAAKTQNAYEAALNERMASYEGRLLEIEKKLLLKQ